MKRRIRQKPPNWPLQLAAFFVLICTVPFLIGEAWAPVWYLLNVPLSSLLKPGLWRYGPPIYVGIVTLFNAIMLFGVFHVLARAFSHNRRDDA
jgi:hypothetical protein